MYLAYRREKWWNVVNTVITWYVPRNVWGFPDYLRKLLKMNSAARS